jgi:gp16 family phage-associated protein
MTQISTVDLERLRARFFDSGESVADWARTHGFSLQLSYSVLSGRLRAKRGKAHEIAVALGLKHPENQWGEQFPRDIDARKVLMSP